MTKRKLLTAIVLLALYLVAVPLFYRQDNYVLHVFILCSQLSIVALSVRMVYTVGELTFGQVAFVMFGAYGSALLSTRLGLTFWLALPASGLLTAGFAALIAYPILRLKGTYFAMLTLILAEVMRYAVKASDFLGGAKGFLGIPQPGGIQIGQITLIPQFTPFDKLPYYYLIAFLLILAVLVFWRLEKSPIGATFRAVCQDDSLAASIGVNVMGYKILAFSISAFFAGIVGSFSAHYMMVFYPESFSVWDSIYYVLYAFIGGIGYLWGPIVGTFILIWLWEFLNPVAQFQKVVFSGAVIVTILFLPGGLVSLEKYWPSWKTRFRGLFKNKPPGQAVDNLPARSTDQR